MEKWQRHEQPVMANLKSLFQNPGKGPSAVDQMTSAYLVAERRGHRDFLKEQRVLTKLFNRRFVKTTDLLAKSAAGELGAQLRVAEIERLQKGELLTNALHVARRSSLTPTEWAQGALGEEAKILNQDQMVAMFNEYSSRPEFVKTLRNRLRELNRLDYEGTLKSWGGVPRTGATTRVPLDWDLGWNDPSRAAFEEQAPEAYKMFEAAKRAGRIRGIELELSKDVVSGKTGRILSISVERREGEHLKNLVIPMVDAATGTVVMPGGTAVGVGDFVIGADQNVFDLPTWIGKMMLENPNIPIESAYPGAPSLSGEVAAHAYWQAGDPLDARRVAELRSFGDEGTGFYTAQARQTRGMVAKGTTLPLFENEKHKMVTYDELTPKQRVALIRSDINSARFMPMASEAGVYERRYALRRAANLSPWGAPSAEKQDPIWRSITKEWQIAPKPGVQIPDSARQKWSSTAWESLTGADTLPGIRETFAMISPQDRAALSEMSPAAAEAMFPDLYKTYGSELHEALRNFGAMGETVTFRDPEHAGMFQVEGSRTYHMQDVGVREGQSVTEDMVLGFNEKNRVLPIGSGVVSEIAETDTGFAVSIRHALGLQGAKTDTAGVKGMGRVTEHFAAMRDILNQHYRRIGSKDYISSDVNVLAPAEYAMDKMDPAHTYMGLAEDILNRFGENEISKGYLARMGEQGITFNYGQLVIDAAKNQIESDKLAAERILTLAQINEDFFAQAGAALRTAGQSKDPIFNAFIQSGSTNLGDWMMKNHLSLTTYAWDHSLVNTPRFATITHDVGTYLRIGGQNASLKAIQSRLQTVSGGDPRQALEFGKSLFAGKYSGNVIPASEAFLQKASIQSAAGRAGSIFDPSIAQYRENFQMTLANGQVVPVPGTAAYGAESPQFAPGEYQTHQWQHTLHEMAAEKDPAKLEAMKGKLLDQYSEAFLTGKQSALRPHAFDPMGVSGVLGVAAEQGDPFLARLSPEVVASIRSQRVREALQRGEDVVGLLHRQPTNFLPFLKYRMDKSLAGTREIATSERVSRLMFGDVDKDNVNALFFDVSTRMENNKLVIHGWANDEERAAAQEALDAIQGGKQAQIISSMEEVLGTSEVANLNQGYTPKSLYGRTEKFAKGVADRARVAINRTAGASIGGYSNELTEVTEHLARSKFFANDYQASARLNALTFSMIRQAPISARKAHATFSLETALQKLNQLKSSIANENSTASANQLMDTFMGLGKTLHGEDWVTKKEYQYLTGEKAISDMTQWAATRTEKGRLAKQALTATIDQGRPFGEQFAAKNLPRIMSDVEGVLGAHHGGRMADESASRLGSISEFLAEKGRAVAGTATGRAGKFFAEHGASMAVGLGALAALGVALTPNKRRPIATFSRTSSNRYRPEEMIGVPGAIPGEPTPGEMSSNPPRRVMEGSPGVRKAMVAPMRNTSDLTVQMHAFDHSRAADTARQVAMIPGSGDTNVTINYRDRTKLRSLRTREQIREIHG